MSELGSSGGADGGLPNVAVYWDFENIHASLVEERWGGGSYQQRRFAAQDSLVDIAAVVAFARGMGAVTINRAYANWQWLSRYRFALQDHAVDTIQLFPVVGAKNGADIRLAVDVVDDLHRFAHVREVIIVGGDSDFVPLAQQIRRMGRRVTAVGTPRATSGRLISAVDGFRYYDSLVSVCPGVTPESAPRLGGELECSSFTAAALVSGGGGGPAEVAAPAQPAKRLTLREVVATAAGPGIGAGKLISVPVAVRAAAEVFSAQETLSSWEEFFAKVSIVLEPVVAEPARAAWVVKSLLFRSKQFRLLGEDVGIQLAGSPDTLLDRVVDSLVDRVRMHAADVDPDVLASLLGWGEEEVALLSFELRLRLVRASDGDVARAYGVDSASPSSVGLAFTAATDGPK